MVIAFNRRLLPNIFKLRDHRRDLEQFGKQDSFKHALKRLTNMYKEVKSE